MNLRIIVIAILFLAAGLSALVSLQVKFGVGSFITSPQQVTVPLGGRVIVGGGRAGVELGSRRDDSVELWVRCQAEQSWVTLEVDEASDEVCSIRIKLVELSSETGTLATSRAHLEVTWGLGASEEPDA